MMSRNQPQSRLVSVIYEDSLNLIYFRSKCILVLLLQVLVGEHDTADSHIDRRDVMKIRIHPKYNHENADYDFSILFLSSPLTFSSSSAISNCEVVTVSGPDTGSTCIFPFTFQGVTYTECAEDSDGKWCSTEVDV